MKIRFVCQQYSRRSMDWPVKRYRE